MNPSEVELFLSSFMEELELTEPEFVRRFTGIWKPRLEKEEDLLVIVKSFLDTQPSFKKKVSDRFENKKPLQGADINHLKNYLRTNKTK